ncbi:MAG: ABC transporter ATP-binding protein [Methanomicrobiaceae archaeon]|nr:ABC transporter ATP-binding protein [Methanomicrobiaceae archaeon]
MYAVEAVDVSRRFGRRTAIDELTLQVRTGEIVGLIGLNGAGKTTTLQMIAGLQRPDEGFVRVFGYDIHARGAGGRMTVGVLPADAEIRVTSTAMENLMRVAERHYVRPEEALRRGSDLLVLLGLGDRADQRVKEFSKGMKRRLAIAMSVINYPLLLVLDEPTSALDIESVLVIREVIRELNRRGTTILLTTHVLEEADILCDRVAVLHEGKIVAFDTPERLKQSVVHEVSLVVRFRPDAPNVMRELHRLRSVNEIVQENGGYRLGYAGLPDILRDLAAYSRKTGRTITALQIRTPNLAEAFLHHTGVRLPPQPTVSVRWIAPPESGEEDHE